MSMMIAPGVYMVGGPELSDDKDACIYLVEGPGEAALIDAGAGDGLARVLDNIAKAGVEASRVKHLVITHCHVDHAGGAPGLKSRLGLQVICHKLCAVSAKKSMNL